MSNAIEAFFSGWSQPEDATRLATLSSALAPTAHYVDPRTETALCGPQAICDYVGQFTQAAPGASANVVASQTQSGMTRATIAFRMADGMEQMGQYFIEFDADEKIARMTGFVGTGAPE